MNSPVSNTPVESSLTLMVSGADALPRADKAGAGEGPSAFAGVMAEQYGAAEGTAGAAAEQTQANGQPLPPTADPLLQGRVDLLAFLRVPGEVAEAAKAGPSADQPDGNALPLPEIVAALADGAAMPGGKAEARQLATGDGEAAISPDALPGAELPLGTDLPSQAGVVAVQPELTVQLDQPGLADPAAASATNDPLADQEALAAPMDQALGQHMLQQLSGPIGRHLGQQTDEPGPGHVGLQLGHTLRKSESNGSLPTGAVDGEQAATASLVPAHAAAAAEAGEMFAQAAQKIGQAQDVVAEPALDQLLTPSGAAASLEAVSTAPLASGLPTSATPQTVPSYQAPPVLAAPGQPGWDQAMGERVLWMVGKEIQGAEVRINPPHLGPVEIRLSIQNDQANVIFTAHHAGVREALEAAVPRLREMLAENNLQLVNVDVGQRERGEQHGPSDFLRRLADDDMAFGGAGGDGDEGLALPMRVYRTDGMVDYYA